MYSSFTVDSMTTDQIPLPGIEQSASVTYYQSGPVTFKTDIGSGQQNSPAVTPETNFIRLRGVPFSAREEDIRTFLGTIQAKTVTFTLTATGRASGECYVELNDTGAVKDALLLHKKEMSGRYIEVFAVSEMERVNMVRHGVIRGPGESGPVEAPKYVVRLRGLPFQTNNDDVKEFFAGLDVKEIVIDMAAGGRPSGEAFVQLASKEHAEKALERNKSYMGSRYIEVFRSSSDEMEHSYYVARGHPPPRGRPIPLREAAAALDFRRPSYQDDFLDYDDAPSDDFGPPSRRSRYGSFPLKRHRVSPYEMRGSRYDRWADERMWESPEYGYGGRYYDEPDFFEECDEMTLFMRGLPYNVNTVDIETFFNPIRCGEIRLGYNDNGRPTGDGFVRFSSPAEVGDAIERNGMMMGPRYIELFPLTKMPPNVKRAMYRVVFRRTSLDNGRNSPVGSKISTITPLMRGVPPVKIPAPTSKPVPLAKLASAERTSTAVHEQHGSAGFTHQAVSTNYPQHGYAGFSPADSQLYGQNQPGTTSYGLQGTENGGYSAASGGQQVSTDFTVQRWHAWSKAGSMATEKTVAPLPLLKQPVRIDNWAHKPRAPLYDSKYYNDEYERNQMGYADSLQTQDQMSW